MSEDGDLTLKVLKSNDKEEEVMVTMTQVLNKEISSGRLICQPSPCTYSIVLDNSGIRGKTIFYKCDIEKIET